MEFTTDEKADIDAAIARLEHLKRIRYLRREIKEAGFGDVLEQAERNANIRQRLEQVEKGELPSLLLQQAD